MKNNFLNKIYDLKNKIVVVTGSCGQLGYSMCDLFVSILHKHGIDMKHFGDSTGELNVV